jgi:hypothetical protein
MNAYDYLEKLNSIASKRAVNGLTDGKNTPFPISVSADDIQCIFAMVEEMKEVIEFYADHLDTWISNREIYSVINDDDLSHIKGSLINHSLTGGKRARSIAAKYWKGGE